MTAGLVQLIPKNIIKIYLINNHLIDESHQELFQVLAET